MNAVGRSCVEIGGGLRRSRRNRHMVQKLAEETAHEGGVHTSKGQKPVQEV